MPWWSQDGAAVRFDWGAGGVARLAPACDVVVVVDVLRFTTTVETAVAGGVAVEPSGVATRDGGAPSLCPFAYADVEPGTRVVLPSPNGSACAHLAASLGATVVAGCLRNAPAVAAWVGAQQARVAVVACGERWDDGSLRPSLEDLLGAAAVIRALGPDRSAEASAAGAAFPARDGDLVQLLAACASGRELAERGHADDVAWAAAHGASACVPVLVDGAFAAAS